MRIYGPVPSRRFGLSLGVDVVPRKTCTYDCIYCQVGPPGRLPDALERFYPVDEILKDVAEALDEGPTPDVVTLAGSGEPTLYSELGALIDGLHALAKAPVLLITNGSLLWREGVAAAARKAEILAPSLDAGDPETFARINRPTAGVPFERMVEGLRSALAAHPGEVRLEVMLVRGVNDGEESLRAIERITRTLRFDRLDLNTPVRPPVPERGALPCDEETLARAVAIFGSKAVPIGTFDKKSGAIRPPRSFDDFDKDIREMILRRPCTVEDIAASLGAPLEAVAASLSRLDAAGLAERRDGQAGAYWAAPKKQKPLV
ncbi:MAG: radical SAM protein [Proteobacteria bacterium]|jgi:wyosine [tRNA(Phe)-imidazoG37] synthetase (radical SAM superfamily)|nr:radical SAM protein [Pseudomonadota bacterium]